MRLEPLLFKGRTVHRTLDGIVAYYGPRRPVKRGDVGLSIGDMEARFNANRYDY